MAAGADARLLPGDGTALTAAASSTDRRVVVADAAIRVVADQGLRGLTHRAVDAAAGLPQGSTSNHFRTRTALVEAVADRILARELDTAAGAFRPTDDLDEFLAGLARFAVTLIADQSDLARVRLTLFLAWPQRFAAGHRQYQVAVQQALAAAGVADSELAAAAVADHLDGLILHSVTVRGDVPDVEEVAARLRRLVGRSGPGRGGARGASSA